MKQITREFFREFRKLEIELQEEEERNMG